MSSTPAEGTNRPTVGGSSVARVGLFALVLLIASVVPIPGAGSPSSGILGPTAIFHVVGYAILTWLLIAVTGRTARGVVLAALGATGYGAAIELLQLVVPWRSFAVLDILLNAIGAGLAVLVIWNRTLRTVTHSRDG